MFEIGVIISLICIGIYMHALNVRLKYFTRLLEREPIADEQSAEVSDKREEAYVDPFDAEEIKKKQAFNERIARIKDELALEHSKRMNRTSESAQELHPDVHNLPHDSIITSEGLPDVEYAD